MTKENKKPLILITNDDGVHAPGIRNLIDAVKDIGNIIVLAPDKPQSAMGHAVTIINPLRINKLQESENYVEYSCNGTPADCVKLAEKELLKRKPDLIVSGINHGSNSSINVIYSGTMAAVIEGAMSGITSVGFSLNNQSINADFSHCIPVVKSIVENILQNGLPSNVCLNVNIPDSANGEIKGIKVTRQAKAYWNETFDKRKDPHGRPYYWLTGEFINLEDDPENDLDYLDSQYVTIVPVKLDLTSYETIDLIKNWDFKF